MVLLTPGKESQRDQGSVFRFEAFEQRCDSDKVEDHVEEVEMRQWEQIEPVHYNNSPR